MLKLHLQNMRLPPQVTTETVLSALSFCLVSSDVIECSIFPTFVHSPVYKDKKQAYCSELKVGQGWPE